VRVFYEKINVYENNMRSDFIFSPGMESCFADSGASANSAERRLYDQPFSLCDRAIKQRASLFIAAACGRHAHV